jgi:hypothetical protein
LIQMMTKHESVTIDSNGKYEKRDFNINSITEDQWIKWNMTRDGLTKELRN